MSLELDIFNKLLKARTEMSKNQNKSWQQKDNDRAKGNKSSNDFEMFVEKEDWHAKKIKGRREKQDYDDYEEW